METQVGIDLGPISLEGTLALPDSRALGGVVICHPHPLHGGEMDNPVVVRASEVCLAAGLATLRFNFRGVGRSGGVYSDGEGEEQDVTSALDHLERELGSGRPLGVAGYSFGAWVGSRVAHRDRRVTALAAIAPPLARQDFGFWEGSFRAALLVAGSDDPYCPVDDLRALAARGPGTEAAVIEGANHFFFGKLFPLGEAVGRWARRWSGIGVAPGDAAGHGSSRG